MKRKIPRGVVETDMSDISAPIARSNENMRKVFEEPILESSSSLAATLIVHST